MRLSGAPLRTAVWRSRHALLPCLILENKMAEDHKDEIGTPDGTIGKAARWHWGAFGRGLLLAFSVPAAVLFGSALGFGALARDGGFSIAQAAFMTASMQALPNQVVLVDQLSRNETMLVAALAVAVTAVRLLPMTVTLVPLLGDRARRTLPALLAVHFVAVTNWVEARRQLPTTVAPARLAHYLGFGVATTAVALTGTVAGHIAAGNVPAVVAAALLLMTPLYFLLSLVATSQTRVDLLAIAMGCGLAPLLYVVAPGFDLLATGLIGGTLAFLLGRSGRGGADELSE
jgi:predicted branched-subunit amino acid permease